jgi:hypothetical protein
LEGGGKANVRQMTDVTKAARLRHGARPPRGRAGGGGAAAIAHELNNTLQEIAAWAGVISRQLPAEPRLTAAAGAILAAVARARDTTRRMLDRPAEPPMGASRLTRSGPGLAPPRRRAGRKPSD